LVRHLGAASQPDLSLVWRLGNLLHSSPGVHRAWRCHAKIAKIASGLLEHAAADETVAASPVFWTTYAEAQLREWKLSGAYADAQCLQRARDGWAHAVEAGAPAGPGLAEVQQLLGDHSSAKASLERPGTPDDRPALVALRRGAPLRISEMYQHALLQPAQAVALLFSVATNGDKGLFSKSDVLFLLARCYEDWGDLDGAGETERRAALAAKDTAKALYAKLFIALLNAGAVSGTEEEWLTSAATWRFLGDKCAAAGLALYAADLYAQCAARCACGRGDWLRLAKMHQRRGSWANANSALDRAFFESSSGRDDTQLRRLRASWGDARQRDTEERPSVPVLVRSLPRSGADDPRVLAATVIAAVARRRLRAMPTRPKTGNTDVAQLSAADGAVVQARPERDGGGNLILSQAAVDALVDVDFKLPPTKVGASTEPEAPNSAACGLVLSAVNAMALADSNGADEHTDDDSTLCLTEVPVSERGGDEPTDDDSKFSVPEVFVAVAPQPCEFFSDHIFVRDAAAATAFKAARGVVVGAVSEAVVSEAAVQTEALDTEASKAAAAQAAHAASAPALSPPAVVVLSPRRQGTGRARRGTKALAQPRGHARHRQRRDGEGQARPRGRGGLPARRAGVPPGAARRTRARAPRGAAPRGAAPRGGRVGCARHRGARRHGARGGGARHRGA